MRTLTFHYRLEGCIRCYGLQPPGLHFGPGAVSYQRRSMSPGDPTCSEMPELVRDSNLLVRRWAEEQNMEGCISMLPVK